MKKMAFGDFFMVIGYYERIQEVIATRNYMQYDMIHSCVRCADKRKNLGRDLSAVVKEKL